MKPNLFSPVPISLTLFISWLVLACHSVGGPDVSIVQFVTSPERRAVIPGQIDEASGMVDSRSMPNKLWVEEDDGNPAQLSLLGYDGTLVGRYPLPGTTNRDWEDLSIGPGPIPNIMYLYLADIGDNNATNLNNTVYRFAEPSGLTEPSGAVDRIQFRYPDGARDAETLILDPLTRDLWIVTKRETNVHIYRLPYPQSTTEIIVAESIGELPLSYVTGGSISTDGRQILLKTYTGLFYWTRQPGESIGQALLRTTPRQLAYLIEPQGEIVCFTKEGTGFFTLSERASAASVTLNYYARQ